MVRRSAIDHCSAFTGGTVLQRHTSKRALLTWAGIACGAMMIGLCTLSADDQSTKTSAEPASRNAPLGPASIGSADVTLFTKFDVESRAPCKLELVVREHPDPVRASSAPLRDPESSIAEVIRTPIIGERAGRAPKVLFRGLAMRAVTGRYFADAVIEDNREDGCRVFLVQSSRSGFSLLSFDYNAEPVGLKGKVKQTSPAPANATEIERDALELASLERHHFTPITQSPESHANLQILNLHLYKEGDLLTVVATTESSQGTSRRLQFDYSLTEKRWIRADPVPQRQYPLLSPKIGG